MKNIYEVLLASLVITPLAVSTASESATVDLDFSISSLVDITVDDLVNLTEDTSTGLIVDDNLFEITDLYTNSATSTTITIESAKSGELRLPDADYDSTLASTAIKYRIHGCSNLHIIEAVDISPQTRIITPSYSADHDNDSTNDSHTLDSGAVTLYEITADLNPLNKLLMQ